MAEHIEAIEQPINQISKLTEQKPASVNPVVWWTQEQEKRADQLSNTATFFMAQRVKPAEKSGGKAYRKYVAELTLLQQILFYSAQAKKNNAVSNVAKLTSLLAEFKEVYFD